MLSGSFFWVLMYVFFGAQWGKHFAKEMLFYLALQFNWWYALSSII
jgi:hypothetical protein